MTTETSTLSGYKHRNHRLTSGQIGDLTLKLIAWKERIESQYLTVPEITRDLANVLTFKVTENNVRAQCQHHGIRTGPPAPPPVQHKTAPADNNATLSLFKALEERVERKLAAIDEFQIQLSAELGSVSRRLDEIINKLDKPTTTPVPLSNQHGLAS